MPLLLLLRALEGPWEALAMDQREHETELLEEELGYVPENAALLPPQGRPVCTK